MVYLETIQKMDWQTMHNMLSEDARYTDPTMTFYDRPGIDLTGPDSITAFWRDSSADSGTNKISYSTNSCFETAGYHVINYSISIDVAGEFWNVNKDTITLPGQVTSVIRVEGNRITEHADYVDYAAAERQVEKLREQYGTVE